MWRSGFRNILYRLFLQIFFFFHFEFCFLASFIKHFIHIYTFAFYLILIVWLMCFWSHFPLFGLLVVLQVAVSDSAIRQYFGCVAGNTILIRFVFVDWIVRRGNVLVKWKIILKFQKFHNNLTNDVIVCSQCSYTKPRSKRTSA